MKKLSTLIIFTIMMLIAVPSMVGAKSKSSSYKRKSSSSSSYRKTSSKPKKQNTGWSNSSVKKKSPTKRTATPTKTTGWSSGNKKSPTKQVTKTTKTNSVNNKKSKKTKVGLNGKQKKNVKSSTLTPKRKKNVTSSIKKLDKKTKTKNMKAMKKYGGNRKKAVADARKNARSEVYVQRSTPPSIRPSYIPTVVVLGGISRTPTWGMIGGGYYGYGYRNNGMFMELDNGYYNMNDDYLSRRGYGYYGHHRTVYRESYNRPVVVRESHPMGFGGVITILLFLILFGIIVVAIIHFSKKI